MSLDREYIVEGIRKLRGPTFKGILGDGTGRVTVAGKANFVWLRPRFGSDDDIPIQAFNQAVPPINGRAVKVREINARGIKGYEVIGFDTGIIYYHDDTGHEPLPAHGWTHEAAPGAGIDPMNLYTRGWAELRVEPTDPASLYCYATYGWYLFDIPTWFPGGNTPLFVPPGAAGARYDVVYIDSSGTIGIEQGTPAAPAFAQIPEPPDYVIPLAAVYFTGSAGSISESMILDCRVMPNVKYPAGGTIFDDSITPSAVQSGLGSWCGSEDYAARADHRHNITGSSMTISILDGVGQIHNLTFLDGLFTTYVIT